MRMALVAVVASLLVSACGRFGFELGPAGGSGANGNGDGGDGNGVVLSDGSRPDIVFTSNVAFVTAQTATPGSFGGLAGADAFCQSAADQASLPGTYIAWLSTSSTDAITRLAGSRGWVRTDGFPIADAPSAFATGALWAPISLTADGSDQGFENTLVVTGTDATGVAAATTCGDWTDPAASGSWGNLYAIDDGWTVGSAATSACAGPSRIYCFGIGNNVPLTKPPLDGRRAFFSRPLGVGGGVAALDAECQADADAASLGATFRAFVATETASAISRFDTTGPRWVRMDGVPLAPTAADLTIGFRVPLNTYADGSYYNAPFGAVKSWTGASTPSAVETGDTSCVSWTSTGASKSGYYGRPALPGTNGFYDGGAGRRCDDTSYGVYCLEQ